VYLHSLVVHVVGSCRWVAYGTQVLRFAHQRSVIINVNKRFLKK
jgi:hypothetical protein